MALNEIKPGGGMVLADKAIARRQDGKFYVEGRKKAMGWSEAEDHLFRHHMKTGKALFA
jgi:hypothetical protein